MANPNPAGLAIIRIAFGTGVLMFGAVAYFLSQSRPADTAVASETLTWAAWWVWGAAISALTAWRLLRARHIERGDASTLIVGWAIGEVPALFGAVYLLLTGQLTLLLPGYVVFAAAMVLFPLPRR